MPGSSSIKVVTGWPSPRAPGSVDTGTVYTRPLLPKASRVSTVRHSKVRVQAIAGLEGEARRLVPWPWPWRARTQPFCETTTVTGSSITLISATALLLGLDQRAARVGELLGVLLDLLDHQAAQRRRAAEDFFQLLLLFAQVLELLLDLDRFQPRQLAQADFQDVLGLAVAQG